MNPKFGFFTLIAGLLLWTSFSFGADTKPTETKSNYDGGGYNKQSDLQACNTQRASWNSSISAASSICTKVGQSDLNQCAQKLGQCGTVPDDGEEDDDSSSNTLSDYCQDHPSEPACSKVCKQQFANSLASAKKDYLEEMRKANKDAGEDQKAMSDSAKDEARLEAEDQKAISDAQQRLQDAVQKFKEQTQNLSQEARNQINMIINDIAKLRTQQNKIMGDREKVIRNYATKMAQAKKNCADAIAAKAGTAGYQLGNISDLFAAQNAGGLANKQCAQDRQYRIDAETAMSEAQGQIDDLANQYQQANDQITKDTNDLNSLKLTMSEKQQLAISQLQTMIQQAQQNISTSQQKLQRDQQLFQQSQQVAQGQLQKDEAIAQQATQDNNSVLSQLKGLGSGVIPNSSATSSSFDDSLKTVSEGRVAACMVQHVKAEDCSDQSRADCTHPGDTSSGSSGNKGNGNGNADKTPGS